jgi:hypothetical protein
VKRRLLGHVSTAFAVAAVAVPMARATDYDGYKSGYPQLHALLAQQQAPPVAPTSDGGFDRLDGGIGAATAAGSIFVLAGGAVLFNRRRSRLAV